MSEILFADVDSQTIEQKVLTCYEQIANTTLHPGNPVRLFLESVAYIIAIQNNIINLAGRQNLLAYAQGDHLDYIGHMVGTDRLGGSYATSVQRFHLAKELNFDVSIPKGTRVTTGDGNVVFVTDEDALILKGELYVDVPITATLPGSGTNGFVAGQLNQMIDPIAYVTKTENLKETLFGSNVEDDERYRARIREAPETFSCAGPKGAYHYYAMSAHRNISEVCVWCPKPGVVDVRPVMDGGELPTDEVLEAVDRALNSDKVRPLSDTVTVQSPELIGYTIDLTWYLPKNMQSLLSTITARVNAAVENYRIWQRTVPGRDILPLKLMSLVEQAGARRVELPTPQYTPIECYQLARETSVSVTYGGVEE